MSVPYHDILAAAGTRCNALVGAKAGPLETTYLTRPLTAANFQSSIFPFSDYIAQTASAVQKLSQTIADVRDHPWRRNLAGRTADLASGATIPAADNAGASIIGVYGNVIDSDDGQVLSEQPDETIRRRLLTPSLWKIPVYHFSLTGDSILHTRTEVYLEVCVLDYGALITAIGANDDMALPDVLAEAVICGTVALMVRDDEFVLQAGTYAEYFAETLKAIRGGATVLPVKEAA